MELKAVDEQCKLPVGQLIFDGEMDATYCDLPYSDNERGENILVEFSIDTGCIIPVKQAARSIPCQEIKLIGQNAKKQCVYNFPRQVLSGKRTIIEILSGL